MQTLRSHWLIKDSISCMLLQFTLMQRLRSHWLIQDSISCMLLQLTLNVLFNCKSMFCKYIVFIVTFKVGGMNSLLKHTFKVSS